MISGKSNAKKIIRALRVRRQWVLPIVTRALTDGLYRFQSRIIRRQMTGRPGLNVQSGNLRRSWYVITEADGSGDVSVSLTTRSKYARVHQGRKTGPRTWVPSRVRTRSGGSFVMPKRLHVYEDWHKWGTKNVVRLLAKRLVDGLARR